MIDLGSLINDPDFCESFIIRRRNGEWQKGRFVTVHEDMKVTGIVEPTSGDDLEQLPEGDRVRGMMTFYTKEQLNLALDPQQADHIICRGKVYKAVQVLDWSRHGFYKTIASFVEVAADEQA